MDEFESLGMKYSNKDIVYINHSEIEDLIDPISGSGSVL